MKIRAPYLLAAFFLVAVEVFIAAFVHDGFVRPYLGDTIATILVYVVLMVFPAVTSNWAIMGALVVSFLVEWMQFIHMLEYVGMENNKMAVLFFGSAASWEDVVAYSIGGVMVYLFTQKETLKKLI